MRGRLAALCALLLLVAGSCRGGEEARAVQEKPEEPPPPPTCPLTGELAPDGFDAEKPPVAIKVDNVAAARPHAGLEAADLVYEELVEGGITRFMAIFHCEEAEVVGPVRSARMVDPDILVEFSPVIFGYSGANSEVSARLESTEGIIDLPEKYHGAHYWKMGGRFPPSNLAVSTLALRELAEERGAPATGFVFQAEADLDGDADPSPQASPTTPPGASVSFSYTGSAEIHYTYSPAEGRYLRFHDDSPHTSAGGGHLGAVNVVILKVPVGNGSIRDAAGNYSPEISVVGEGEAVVLRGGVAVTGRWVRTSLRDRTHLLYEDGDPIELLPGSTWIHLLPESRPVQL